MAFCKFCGTEIPADGNCPQCSPQIEVIETPQAAAPAPEPAQPDVPKVFCKFCGTAYPADGACPKGCQPVQPQPAPAAPVAPTAPIAPAAPAYAAAPVMHQPLKERSFILYILLSGITLGIYPLVTMYGISKDINTIASPYDGQKTSNFIVMLLLSGITFGIYPLVWYHKLSGRIGAELRRRGIPYDFGTKDFWLWQVLGMMIGVGPIIYTYKLFTAINKLSENFNAVALGIAPAYAPYAPYAAAAPAAPAMAYAGTAPAPQPAPQTAPQMAPQTAPQTAPQMPPQMPPYSPPVPKTDAQENLIMGILSYVGLLCLVPIFAAKKSKFARYHAAQGFNLLLGHAAVILVQILLKSFASTLVRIGESAGSYEMIQFVSGLSVLFTIVCVLLWLGMLAFSVLGIVNAAQGKEAPVPVFSKLELLQVSEEGEPDFKGTGKGFLLLAKKVPKLAYIILAAVVGVLLLVNISVSIANAAKISRAKKEAAAVVAAQQAELERQQAELEREMEEDLRAANEYYEDETEVPTTVAAVPEKTLNAATPTLVFSPAELTILGSSNVSEGYVTFIGGLENGFEFAYTASQQGTAQLQAAVRPFEGRPYGIYVNGALFREVEVPGEDSFSIVTDIPVNFGSNTIKIVGTETKYWAPDFATLTLMLNGAQEETTAEGETAEAGEAVSNAEEN